MKNGKRGIGWTGQADWTDRTDRTDGTDGTDRTDRTKWTGEGAGTNTDEHGLARTKWRAEKRVLSAEC